MKREPLYIAHADYLFVGFRQIYWSTSAFATNEATAGGQVPYVGGTLALDGSGLQTSHTITVSNLQPNTVYYYFMRSIDTSGMMSVVLLNTTHTLSY